MFEAAIRAERLTKRFEDVLAVDSISFEVGCGTITALLGGTGAALWGAFRHEKLARLGRLEMAS